LVPDTNAAYPALLLGIIGIMFTAAALRSLLDKGRPKRTRNSQVGLMTLLLLTFGFEIASSIRLFIHPHDTGALQDLSYLLLISLVIGIARAWELVGRRQTGLFESVRLLSGGKPKVTD